MSKGLAYTWQISDKERETMKARVAQMVKIKSSADLSEEEQKQFFAEWVNITNRLRKGKELITKMERQQEPGQDLRLDQNYIKLTHLYEFLFTMLGYYDLFFKQKFPKEEHERYQTAILQMFDRL
ncbi:hypothetical protein AAXE64_27135 [Priestia megaterium]|uniref:hypothetical protein n=1 Tax=Priestia megaterium TaxID=1404 RepID=UPI003D07CF9A